MRLLLRTVGRMSGGGIEYHDAEYSGDAITLGQATDQLIRLAGAEVALRHARIISASSRSFQIKADPVASLAVNEKTVRSAVLSIGDIVKIGNNTLQVIEAPPGFDIALTLEPAGEDGIEDVPGAQYVMTLGATGVSKRRWSWLLGLGVLLVFIIIPMVGVFNGGVNKILRNTPLPSDSLWLTGPLSSAHHIPEIGNDCNVCHVSIFKMVPDKPCVKCHKNVGHHVDYKIFDVAELKNRRCASCHKEHNEPEMMVRRDQKVCADCHQHIAGVVDSSKLDIKDAGDFLSNHPDFRISLLQPEKTGDITQWKTVRKRYPGPGLKEQSNLKFSHKVHLDAKGIDSPDGNKVLVCADCHEPDSSGRRMLPIVMEKHCRKCHSLAFDEADPDREVPHGDPDKVIIALEEYYSRLYLKGEVEEVTAPSGRRRTVHRHRTGETGVSNGDALIKAKRMAQNAGEQLFGHVLVDGACKTCHFISISNNAKFLSKWRVEPVLLEQTWMPNASFDHGSHRMQPCSDCHKAKDSDKSSDILLPGIKTCRNCHGGEKDNNMVATTCIECHKFHVPDNVSHDKKAVINDDARHLHLLRTKATSTLN